MKKIVILMMAVMVAVSGSLIAENISFSYGTNFFSPSNSGFATSNGQVSALEWTLDTGLTLGVINEQTVLDYASGGDIGDFSLTGIRITQNVIDRVSIGIGLGSATADFPVAGTAVTNPVVDIIGNVTIFEGQGEDISGSLVASIASRFMNTDTLNTGTDPVDNLDGTNIGLSVKLGF